MSIQKRTENFLKKSRRKYGKNFNYSLIGPEARSSAPVIYTNLNTQIKLVCRTHDFSFSIEPQNHLKQKYGGCKKCQEYRNNFVVSDRRKFEVVFTCGHTFLTFCDFTDLNTLFAVDSYTNKQVTDYIEKTKQEGRFCYVNKVFFKKVFFTKHKSVFSRVASYGHLSLMKWWWREENYYDGFSSAAKHGNSEIVRWLEEGGCPLNEYTFARAAEQGNVQNMKFLYECDCFRNEYTFDSAAKNTNLTNMKWLFEIGCPWDAGTFSKLALNGNWKIRRSREVDGFCENFDKVYNTKNKVLDGMKWLREKGCPWDVETFDSAAESGILENMKWLREKGCPWGASTFVWAASNTNLTNMKWLLKNGCPWDAHTFSSAVITASMFDLPTNNLKWLKEQGCPWDEKILTCALPNFKSSKWLLENGCVWSYKVFSDHITYGDSAETFRALVQDGCIDEEEYEGFLYRARREDIIK